MLVAFAWFLIAAGLLGLINPRWIRMASRRQAVLALILGMIIGAFAAPGDTAKTAIVEHTIEQRQDISVAGMPRFTYRVTVPEHATEDDMLAVAESIVETEKKRGALSTVTVFFYNPGDNLEMGFTAGRVVYAPDGDLMKAREVSPGNYRRHKYVFNS